MDKRERSGILCALVLLAGCASSNIDGWDALPDAGTSPDAGLRCAGLGCRIARCGGDTKTTLSGVVNIPSGMLPLPNVSVFIPDGALKPIPSGAGCNRCDAGLSASPLAHTLTDEQGRFKLENVPDGADVPLVVQAGKWRRQVTLSQVSPCVDNPVAPEFTRLPRNQREGDLPKIALTTGNVDALECFLRKLGIDDQEFTPEYGSGRVNLFYTNLSTDHYAPGLNGGAAFTPAPFLWSQLDVLKTYDVVVLACEGNETQTNKSPEALQAMKDYLDLGGRVFASHWHNYWIEFGPAPLPSVATFNHRSDLPDPATATIDTTFPRGAALASWMLHVGASNAYGMMSLSSGRSTIESINSKLAQRWIHVPEERSVQYLSFNTPVGAEDKAQCGRMVMTDIHVSDQDVSYVLWPFPTGCKTFDFRPQEKALVYMFFDLSNCLQPVIG